MRAAQMEKHHGGGKGPKSPEGGQRCEKAKQQVKEDNVGSSPEVSKVEVKYNQEPRP